MCNNPDQATTSVACRICSAGAVTKIPLGTLRPLVRRTYGHPGEFADTLIPLCGVCAKLHCEVTLPEDGPDRNPSLEEAADILKSLRGAGHRIFVAPDDGQTVVTGWDYVGPQMRTRILGHLKEIRALVFAELRAL